jgi:hypothetical protein
MAEVNVNRISTMHKMYTVCKSTQNEKIKRKKMESSINDTNARKMEF